jgi:hypothetical protein
MPSVLQEIAQRFETVDPARARELRRIEQVYISFGLSDGAVARKPFLFRERIGL